MTFVNTPARSRMRAAMAATALERRDRSDRAWRDALLDERRLATARMLDEVLTEPDQGLVDLGRLVDRVVTLVQLSSNGISFAATSMPTVELDAEMALAIAAAVRELAYAIECAAEAVGGVSLYVAGEWDGVDLTIALACPEAAQAPVPSASGLAAIARADLLAALAGGTLVHGVRDGRALFGVAFRLFV